MRKSLIRYLQDRGVQVRTQLCPSWLTVYAWEQSFHHSVTPLSVGYLAYKMQRISICRSFGCVPGT